MWAPASSYIHGRILTVWAHEEPTSPSPVVVSNTRHRNRLVPPSARGTSGISDSRPENRESSSSLWAHRTSNDRNTEEPLAFLCNAQRTVAAAAAADQQIDVLYTSQCLLLEATTHEGRQAGTHTPTLSLSIYSAQNRRIIASLQRCRCEPTVR